MFISMESIKKFSFLFFSLARFIMVINIFHIRPDSPIDITCRYLFLFKWCPFTIHAAIFLKLISQCLLSQWTLKSSSNLFFWSQFQVNQLTDTFLHIVFHKKLNLQFCTDHFLNIKIHYVCNFQWTYFQLSHHQLSISLYDYRHFYRNKKESVQRFFL